MSRIVTEAVVASLTSACRPMFSNIYGVEGVSKMISILQTELEGFLRLIGQSDIHALNSSYVRISFHVSCSLKVLTLKGSNDSRLTQTSSSKRISAAHHHKLRTLFRYYHCFASNRVFSCCLKNVAMQKSRALTLIGQA